MLLVPIIPDLLRAKVKVFVELLPQDRSSSEQLNSELEQRVAERTAELAVRVRAAVAKASIAGTWLLAAGKMGSWDWISLMATACGRGLSAASLGSIRGLSRRRPKASKPCWKQTIGSGCNRHGLRRERMGVPMRLNFVCADLNGSCVGVQALPR